MSPCAVGVVVILILNCHSRLNLYSEKVTVLLSLLSRSFRWKTGSENMGKGREHCFGCSAVLWVSQDVWPERSGLCVSLLREKEFVIHALLKRKSAGLFCLNTPQ